MATSSAAAASQTPPACAPVIVAFGYTEFDQKGKNRKAKCKEWGAVIKEKGSTTRSAEGAPLLPLLQNTDLTAACASVSHNDKVKKL